MSFELPRLTSETPTDYERFTVWWVTVFLVYWQQAMEAIETQINEILDVQAAIVAAQAAADAANAAAVAADAAAAGAQTAADDVTEASALSSSFVSGATISATDAGADADITISAHTRHYPQPDGTTVDVPVTGATLHGLAYSTRYYIYYDDPTRAGGAVSYAATTSETTAAQIGDRHVVGAVNTPAALGAPSGGEGTRPPGSGTLSRV